MLSCYSQHIQSLFSWKRFKFLLDTFQAALCCSNLPLSLLQTLKSHSHYSNNLNILLQLEDTSNVNKLMSQKDIFSFVFIHMFTSHTCNTAGRGPQKI